MKEGNDEMSNPRRKTPKVQLWEEPLKALVSHGEKVRELVARLPKVAEVVK